ncbi:MAG: ABC transporter permease [Bacteroidaceae bacterium]|nr:ABC transporter permease [Bacteroidaceae bacterium]
MNFPFYVARRYLFSKKSHHAINIISMISLLGVALATTALVCVLSVFNGFHDLVASLFTAFDPELEMLPAEGQTFSENASAVKAVRQYKDVAVASGSLQNRALARYDGRQAMIVLKGVEDNFGECTDVEKILYGNGTFILHADVLNYAIPGIRLALMLNLTTDFVNPLEIYAPRPGERVNLMDPTQSFNQDELNSSGSVFNVNQKQYDSEYVLCALGFAQKIFEKPGEISSLAIKLKSGADIEKAKRELRALAGPKYKILDRYEQQEDIFRIMKVEKLMAFIFLIFILFIASFNIVASLSMLIIDKRQDIGTLRDLGANDLTIRQIFVTEGRMISVAGAVIGLIIGLLLCWAQQQFGLLRLGQEAGTFIVDAYPVSVHALDLVLILGAVIAVSFIASWYPVKYLSRRLLNKE